MPIAPLNTSLKIVKIIVNDDLKTFRKFRNNYKQIIDGYWLFRRNVICLLKVEILAINKDVSSKTNKITINKKVIRFV